MRVEVGSWFGVVPWVLCWMVEMTLGVRAGWAPWFFVAATGAQLAGAVLLNVRLVGRRQT